MIRRAAWLPHLLLAAIISTAVACDLAETGDLGTIDIGDAVVEIIGAAAVPLADDPDPAVQAAGESYAAVDRAREAEAETDTEVTADEIINIFDKADFGGNTKSGDSSGGVDGADSVVTEDDIINLIANLPLKKNPAETQGLFPPIATPAEAREDVKKEPRSAYLHLTQAVAEVAAGEDPSDAKGRAFLLHQLLGTSDEPQREYLGDYLLQLSFGLASAEERNGRDATVQRLLTEYCAQARLWERTYPSEGYGIGPMDALGIYKTEPGCKTE